MSTINQHSNQHKHPIIHSLAVAYRFVASLLSQWRAHMRKQRSLRQLERLDDFLLDDIGLVRKNDQIVPIRTNPIARSHLYNVQETQFRRRARSQKRERHRQLRRRIG